MLEDEDGSKYARNKRFLKLDKSKQNNEDATTNNTETVENNNNENGAEEPATPEQKMKGVRFSEDAKKTDGGTTTRRSERIRKAKDTGDRLVRSLRLQGPATWGPFTYRPGDGTKKGHWVEYTVGGEPT